MKILEGETINIRKIETIWGLNLRNRGHVILEIVGNKAKTTVWMKGEDRIPRKLYKGTKVSVFGKKRKFD